MDTSSEKYLAIIKSLGIDPDNLPVVTDEELLDIPRKNMERFASKSLINIRKLNSWGHMRLHGNNIADNSVAIDIAGKVLISIQKAITNLGASIMGYNTIAGRQPSEIARRTQLKLTASPIPGSIIFTLSPEVDGYDDIYPEGPALFDAEESPLIDTAMSEFMRILAIINTTELGATDELLTRLVDLGPRFTSSLKELLSELSASQIDTELEWLEPGYPTARAGLLYRAATSAHAIIKAYKLDVEEVTLMGRLITISKNKKLELELDSGETIPIERGEVSTDTLSSHTFFMHPVTIKAELYHGTKPGGKPVRKYRALAIKDLDKTSSLFDLDYNKT